MVKELLIVEFDGDSYTGHVYPRQAANEEIITRMAVEIAQRVDKRLGVWEHFKAGGVRKVCDVWPPRTMTVVLT